MEFTKIKLATLFQLVLMTMHVNLSHRLIKMTRMQLLERSEMESFSKWEKFSMPMETDTKECLMMADHQKWEKLGTNNQSLMKLDLETRNLKERSTRANSKLEKGMLNMLL